MGGLQWPAPDRLMTRDIGAVEDERSQLALVAVCGGFLLSRANLPAVGRWPPCPVPLGACPSRALAPVLTLRPG